MPIDLTARVAHAVGDKQLEPVLQRIQGNILKGHGRAHTVNVILRFTKPADEVRAVLQPLLKRVVTSAFAQEQQSAAFRQNGEQKLFGAFFLTATGYAGLGFSPQQLNAAFAGPAGAAFKAGMRAARAALQDTDPATWDAAFQGRVDALLLLAHGDLKQLEVQEKQIVAELAKVAAVLPREWGKALVNLQNEGIEHFGYVDGRSQPIFLAEDLALEGPTNVWDPVEPLGLVLTPDPNVAEPEALGSYYVFRKLEQNVAGFIQAEEALANAMDPVAPNPALAGAFVVGRFRNGTPVAAGAPQPHPAQANDFVFAGVPAAQCPFQAHIRKTNPRRDTEALGGTEDIERSRRIARRGIPYGDRDLQGAPPASGVGLLFACYQSNIEQQFAFIQTRWANETNFSANNVGGDPVIGNRPAIASNWPNQHGGPATVQFSFGNFVTLKGGEYFFAPSMPFLDKLAP